jgi:hypothetical protein
MDATIGFWNVTPVEGKHYPWRDLELEAEKRMDWSKRVFGHQQYGYKGLRGFTDSGEFKKEEEKGKNVDYTYEPEDDEGDKNDLAFEFEKRRNWSNRVFGHQQHGYKGFRGFADSGEFKNKEVDDIHEPEDEEDKNDRRELTELIYEESLAFQTDIDETTTHDITTDADDVIGVGTDDDFAYFE